jgi:hypothetical protein
MGDTVITLPTLHPDQLNIYRLHEDARGGAWEQNEGGRFKAVRCGRRYGKTTFGVTWIADGAIKGEPCGWFAPDYKKIAEVYQDLYNVLKPVIVASSKVDGVIRTRTGGRVDFWTLNDENAGRSRMYRRVFIDESAFTAGNMMDIWSKSIKPTLLDLTGRCITASNTNGVDADNFLWQVCNQPEHGFIEYHAPSMSNPWVPRREPGESETDHAVRRLKEFEKIKAREHPLVWQQEYLADFVDWSGVAFFAMDSLLINGQPVEYPANCDSVFAVMDTATKTGTDNDGTAVTFFARTAHGVSAPLVILDWDCVQIEGALLESWLPSVFTRLEDLARRCGARGGSLGAWIEDKASGEILLQQARRREMPVHMIDSRLTALGKEERALSVSGYVYTGKVKLSREAHDKVTLYKGVTRNHLVSQVTGFRIGDKKAATRADDLLDTFTYGTALALGNQEGF